MNLALWIVAGLLAVVFLVSSAKLFVAREKMAGMGAASRWVEDFSPGALRAIGALELLAAAGLILPAVLDIAPVLVPLAATGAALLFVGAVITRSTSLRGRRTTRVPRLIETAAGVLRVGEWPDPGLHNVLDRYAATWAGWATPVILSIEGATAEDVAACAGALEGVEGVAGLELNLVDHAGAAARIVAATRATTLLPLLAKLPAAPAPGENLAALARAVADAGADAVTIVPSPPGRAADPHTGDVVTGRLAGPAFKPLALLAVADVAAAVDVPVVGGGGIATTEDARQFLAVGAVAVQIGAALLADPDAIARIGADLGADD